MADAAETHNCYRPTYPLQVPSKVSTRPFTTTSPSKAAHDTSLDGLHKEAQSTNDPARWYRSVTDDQAERHSITSRNNSDLLSHQSVEDIQADDGSSTAIPMSQRSRSPVPTSHEDQPRSGDRESTPSSTQLPENRPKEDLGASNSWTRLTYPPPTTTEVPAKHYIPVSTSTPEEDREQVSRQMPRPDEDGTINRTLRRTPRSRRIESLVPSAAVEEALPPNQPTDSEQHTPVSGEHPWKRQAYPLQHITSGSTTQIPASPPSEEGSGPLHGAYFGQVGGNGKASAGEHLGVRQVDSPQPTAGGATALPASPPSSESDLENADEMSTYAPQASTQAAKRNKPWHRQTYPLQAPASSANLRRSPTPPPSPDREPEHPNRVPADQVRERDQLAVRSKAFRRQQYPLQSPASVANLQPSRFSSPPGRGSQREELPSANSSRETELATKVVNHWRRQVYPLQPPMNTTPFQRIPTPQPPRGKPEAARGPGLIQLPKNIRAVTDAEKHDDRGRTIVVCLDGTGDKFDNDNSNIVHLIEALKKDDARQVSYYQAGIGTYGDSGLSGGVTAAMDMAVGSGLGLHVRDAYHFLMHTYKEHDKICIFGFSRGAYTARCLAGMVHKVGLLPPRNIQQIPFAYEFYKNGTHEGWTQSLAFKKTFCIDVSIYFVGCFDSVASVGFIPRQLPLSSTPTNTTRYFRHAMALDERRAKFKVCRHQTKTWEEIKRADAPPGSSPQMEFREKHHPNITDEEYGRLTEREAPYGTDVLEVWFAGAHADVGGGAVPNVERHKLAQITLRWMVRQAFECNTGVIFKTAVLAEYGLDVHTLWPKYERLNVPAHGPPPSILEKYDKSLPPKSIRRSKLVPIDKHEKGEDFYHLKSYMDEDWTPEQVEDFYDAMSPLHDQLVQAPTWWILELLPIQYEVPRAAGEVASRTEMNLGRYRGVEDFEPNLHWTVLHRVEHIGYKIEARTAPHTTWRTVV